MKNKTLKIISLVIILFICLINLTGCFNQKKSEKNNEDNNEVYEKISSYTNSIGNNDDKLVSTENIENYLKDSFSALNDNANSEETVELSSEDLENAEKIKQEIKNIELSKKNDDVAKTEENVNSEPAQNSTQNSNEEQTQQQQTIQKTAPVQNTTPEPTPTQAPTVTQTPVETPTPAPTPAQAQTTTPAKTQSKPANTQSTNTQAVNTYVLNTRSKIFHYRSCASVKKMSAKNRGEFTGTRQQVINQGYKPCGNCHP